MIKILPLCFLLIVASVLATEPANTATNTGEKRLNANGELVLEWDDLIPADFDPAKLFQGISKRYNIKELADDDPQAKQIQAEVRKLWNNAPVVESLNGRRVRLPGLVVPLEGDDKKVSEFLLVPYFGACIHVPPPPSNQIVYVRTGPDKAVVREIYDAVWVVGTLHTEHRHKALGDTGYTLIADHIEPYE